ncbi:MAG: hypothetical protein ABIJ33_00480 [Patescibacteria group bacterium]
MGFAKERHMSPKEASPTQLATPPEERVISKTGEPKIEELEVVEVDRRKYFRGWTPFWVVETRLTESERQALAEKERQKSIEVRRAETKMLTTLANMVPAR